MVIKPNSAGATACGNCGMEDHLLLHNVRYRHLCTTCVLRLHPHSFCPTCFQVYSPPPPNGAVLSCFKCGSSTHSQCIAAPPNPYICPLCVDPNARIFKLKTEEKDAVLMDRDAARKLLAAAKIVSASLNKAAAEAKAVAERRAKEAVLTRKRAKEALEHLANLVMKEKLRKKENAPMVVGKMITGGSNSNAADFRTNAKMGGGEIVEWSDSDIDQILFSDEESGAGNLDF